MRNNSKYVQINNKKRKVTKVILVLSTLVLLLIVNACAEHKVPVENASSKNFVIRFDDKNLEAAIRIALEKPEGAITSAYATNITELNLSKKVSRAIDSYIMDTSHYINSLDGLQYFINLEKLNLRGNNITDITPLKDLKRLKELNLSFNSVSNMGSLRNLETLENLDVSWNGVTDISFLQKLTHLKELWLGNAGMYEYMGNNYNKISELSVLKDMKDLEILDLQELGIKELDALKEMRKLKKLLLANNKIEDISCLKSLVELEYLDIISNNIQDIKPLAELTKLKYLYLYNNRVNNIDKLNKIKELKEFDLSNNFVHSSTEGKQNKNLDDICKSDCLPAIQINENNRFFINEGIQLTLAEELIAEYIIGEGVKGDVKANLKVEEISVKEAWDSDRIQIYKVELDYQWLNGVALIKEGKVLCILEGMPTYEVFLGDVDNNGSYEVYSNIAFGSGMVSNEIRGYNICYSTKYTLSMRMIRDLKLFVQDNILYVKQFDPMANNQDCVEINKLIIKDAGKLGIGVACNIKENNKI